MVSSKIVRLSLLNALFTVVSLYILYFVLYPLTANILIGGLPLMFWGFLAMMAVYWAQLCIFNAQVEKIEEKEGENIC